MFLVVSNMSAFWHQLKQIVNYEVLAFYLAKVIALTFCINTVRYSVSKTNDRLIFFFFFQFFVKSWSDWFASVFLVI